MGANTPFVSYEAESGTLGGGATVISLTSPPTTEFSSPQLEASGHAYVHLAGTGQNVQLVNNTGKAITALNIRYSIPDSSGGGGISSTIDLYVGGTFRGAIAVNSLQTWVYETSSSYNGMSQVPSAGNAHVFWDEASFFVPGGSIPAGASFVLQKDSANSAAYYDIDVVDLETPPAALSQPANSLSITNYGAQANNSSFDNSSALNNCFAACKAQGKIAWIPSGIFYVTSGTVLTPNGITIAGAGSWYSEILDTSTSWANGFLFNATGTSFQDLCIDATKPNSTPGMFAILAYGDNWTINRVWARHSMLTWGTGNNITVENSRVNNSWGDGMNLNNDNGTPCSNVIVSNNFSRGNGDDAIAINSSEGTAPIINHATVVNNTTVASWWANQLAVYGGTNILFANNLLCDSVKEGGIHVDTYSSGSPLNGITVSGNTVLRGGGRGYGNLNPAIKLIGSQTENTVTVANNSIANSMFESIEIGNINNLLVQANTIQSPGTTGIQIDSGATGNGSFINNTVNNLQSGQVAYVNNSGSFTATLSGNSWQGGVTPTNGSTYHLICQTSGMALDNGGSTTAGSVVTQWTDNSGNSNQEWKLVAVGGGYYNLVCQKSNMNLDNGGSTTDGTAVTQYTINSGNINQYWQFVDQGGGYYHLICEKSGKALDNAGSTTAGTTVTQWAAGSGNANQNWKLEFIR